MPPGGFTMSLCMETHLPPIRRVHNLPLPDRHVYWLSHA